MIGNALAIIGAASAGDPLRKVAGGDELKIPAEAYNAFIDTAKAVRAIRQPRGGNGKPPPWPPGLVEVVNASGAAAERFAVLGISGPAFSPAEAPGSFAERPRFEVVAPTEDHVGGRFVVLLEPAADRAVVLAAAGGVTVCKVNVSDTDHRFADAEDGESGALVSAESGPVQLLWVESGTGDGKWAVGRFGGSGGGIPAPTAKYQMYTPIDDTLVPVWTDARFGE